MGLICRVDRAYIGVFRAALSSVDHAHVGRCRRMYARTGTQQPCRSVSTAGAELSLELRTRSTCNRTTRSFCSEEKTLQRAEDEIMQ